MKITRDLEQLSHNDTRILTIGNFDGVHRGHQALLNDVVTRARQLGGESAVLTFDPHPLVIVAPHLQLQFLTTREEKFSLFERAGIAHVICLEFSSQLAESSPDAFAKAVLRDGIGVCELFIGNAFRFGKDRAGTIEDLMRLGPQMNFRVTPITPIQVGSEIVSSSTIRQRINEGRVSEASRLLGRHYALAGIVQKGERHGSVMGCPTANLPLPIDRVIPPNGVYATVTMVDDTPRQSVSYIGTRPTVQGKERLLEVHVFDLEADLYDKHLRVRFFERVRGDMVFATTTELSRQIEDDVRQVRQVFTASGEECD